MKVLTNLLLTMLLYLNTTLVSKLSSWLLLNVHLPTYLYRSTLKMIRKDAHVPLIKATSFLLQYQATFLFVLRPTTMMAENQKYCLQDCLASSQAIFSIQPHSFQDCQRFRRQTYWRVHRFWDYWSEPVQRELHALRQKPQTSFEDLTTIQTFFKV